MPKNVRAKADKTSSCSTHISIYRLLERSTYWATICPAFEVILCATSTEDECNKTQDDARNDVASKELCKSSANDDETKAHGLASQPNTAKMHKLFQWVVSSDCWL